MPYAMPALPPTIRAFLFDLDDTLNDRARSWIKFVELLMHPTSGRLGGCVAADVHRAILAADRGGYRAKDEFVVELLETLPWRVRPSAAEFEAYWRSEFPKCMVPGEAAVDLLKSLRARGYKLGIVTNGRVAMQRAKIESLGLDRLIDVVIISEAIGVKKPNAGIFEAALAAIGARADETVFVGDDPERDIVGPAKVGMRTVWVEVGRTWPAGLNRPDHSIVGFESFENAVLRINGEPSKRP
jgi:putative hydrolase of the HAD superfamily